MVLVTSIAKQSSANGNVSFGHSPTTNVDNPNALYASLKKMLNKQMQIEDAVIHWVPNKNSKFSIELSENTSLIFDEEFWSDRIEESISKNYTIEVEDIPSTPSTVIQNIRLIKSANEILLLELTKRVAMILFDAQNKSGISDGFLIFFRGVRKDREYVCMLKLEGIRGSEANFNKQRNSYEMKTVEKLLITNKTKIFKMAFFEFDDGHLMHTYVMDDQINRNQISKFWLTQFLGCKYIHSTEYYTNEFYSFITDFSTNKRIDTNESLIILSGLYSELSSNNKTLSLAKFSEEYIPETALPEFNNLSSKRDIPLAEFPKFVNPRLNNLIKIRKFTLEEGITIQIPQTSLDSKKIVDIVEKKGIRYIILKSKILKENPRR